MRPKPDPPNHYKPGQPILFPLQVIARGKLVDPASATLTLHPEPNPPLATPYPDVVLSSPTLDSVGEYEIVYVLPADFPPGKCWYRWQTLGTPPEQNGLDEWLFIVDPLAF